MSSLRSNAVLFSLVATLLCMIPVYSSASEPSDHGAIDGFATPEGFRIIAPSLEQISRIHYNFQAYVESGQVSLAKGQQAQEIWLSLQQYLVAQDAEIFRLENEIMQSLDNSRLKAIREITRRSAERERIMISSYLALVNITAEYDHDFDIPYPSQAELNKKQSSQKGSRIKIEFVPEDTLMDVLE